MRVYGLDRILTLENTGETFRMPEGFDVDELFATSFGIYVPEGPGKTITFRTGHTDARYIRDLPLHRSQTEVSSDDRYVTFSIFACPDRNMIMEFCRHAGRLEVLSPEEVRDAVAEELYKGAELYRSNNRSRS